MSNCIYCRREIEICFCCRSVSVVEERSIWVSYIISITVIEERSIWVLLSNCIYSEREIEMSFCCISSTVIEERSIWVSYIISITVIEERSIWVSDVHLIIRIDLFLLSICIYCRREIDLSFLHHIYYCYRREIDTSLWYRSVSVV